MKKLFSIVFVLFLGTSLFAQTTVTGTVKDAKSGETLPGVSIKVAGKSLGTTTDFDGKFTLGVSQATPFKIEVSYIGYATQSFEVTQNNMNLDVSLKEESNRLDEIVVSASRTPESIRESPVTIERMDIRDIKKSTAPDFYSGLENLKGVDLNTSSLTFKSVNTRGFATFANTRFVQLVDGMDNASPALNFVMGNLLGINELDVNSIELLPGASSALYGANAFNGILFMTSKNPFENQGVSSYFRTGITVQNAAGNNDFYDVGFRAATAFSEKFAAKTSFSYMTGTEWYATDLNQYDDTSTPIGEADAILPFGSSYAHDALNIYGDEVATDIHNVALAMEAGGLLPPGVSAFIPSDVVGRTGYKEQDLTDYVAKSAKFDVSLNFRPFANDLEIVWNSRIGFGNTIYQGANRYQLKNFLMQQHKLEIKDDDFFIRGYSTSETAGDSYDMRFTGINMNKVGASTWFGTYVGAYLQGVLAGAPSEVAHAGARQYADATLTPQPGTAAFKTLFNKVTSDPDISTGSKFLDDTKMYVGEGNYNFSRLLNDEVDLQVGGSYRQYSLNSGGTIFTDYDGSIDYKEYGAYMQASKKFSDDRLKLTASLRYDKNEYFNGNVSPRASIVYSAGDHKQHNFRASYQTGFRNPDTQALFIGFNVGRAILVGSSPNNLDRRLPGTALTGRDVYNDSYTLSSLFAFAASGDPSKLVSTVTPLVKPEEVTAYDIGYRGSVGAVSLDINAYYNSYKGFISNRTVVTPNSGSTSDLSGVIDIATGNYTVFQTYTNSTADISSYGLNIGLDTKFNDKFNLGFNYTYAQFNFNQASDADFKAGFNTPQHKLKVSFGSTNLFERVGFNINARWSDKYLWQASIANAMMPSRTVIDAQINYSIPKMKSVFKIGGSNLGGKEYQSAVGTGNIGSQFYVSWVINQ
ncbi:MAG: TonB-dependent receptor [Flavobacteriaceae bacterium]|nr:TonB-dependent receptor [Flavobacteriaceae bacterium]